MISAGTAFARAASQPRVSGVRDFCIAADTSPSHLSIKQNLATGSGNGLSCFESSELPVNVRAPSGGAGGNRSLIRNSFARNRGSRLRAGLFGRDFVTRGTGGDQKCDCRKQNSENCWPSDHEGRVNHNFVISQIASVMDHVIREIKLSSFAARLGSR
jgi:hypothetical protein